MPRIPRVIVPGVPVHVTQRGVNREPTFVASDDFAHYRWALREALDRSGCALHAYALMSNHVHLLVTPADHGGLERMTRLLGARYVRYFNDRHGRTGTLWEGRFRSSIVDSSPYLFACSRYIESNPVRAALADAPIDYEWSSFRRNACGHEDPLVSEHPQYTLLGATPEARCAAYRAMFTEELTSAHIAAMRATTQGRPRLSATRYRETVDAMHASRERAAGRMDDRDDGTGRERRNRPDENAAMAEAGRSEALRN